MTWRARSGRGVVASKTSKDIRNESRFMVLRSAYARGTVTRAEISAETGLSPATVTTLVGELVGEEVLREAGRDRKSTRLNSSHVAISYAVFCLKKKIQTYEGVTN